MPITYLDPKNDLTFRKIFGDHPRLLISFLNAMLPFDNGREIVSIEYLDADLIPELPGLKRSVVDVRCVDNHNRQFIVEMQMYWTNSFKSRMMFNTSKAYVRQLFKKEQFSELRPVYGLSLVNEDFMTGESMKSTYYHHYKMVHNIDSNEVISGDLMPTSAKPSTTSCSPRSPRRSSNITKNTGMLSASRKAR